MAVCQQRSHRTGPQTGHGRPGGQDLRWQDTVQGTGAWQHVAPPVSSGQPSARSCSSRRSPAPRSARTTPPPRRRRRPRQRPHGRRRPLTPHPELTTLPCRRRHRTTIQRPHWRQRTRRADHRRGPARRPGQVHATTLAPRTVFATATRSTEPPLTAMTTGAAARRRGPDRPTTPGPRTTPDRPTTPGLRTTPGPRIATATASRTDATLS